MRHFWRFGIALAFAATLSSAVAAAAQDRMDSKSRLVASLPFGAGQFQNGDADIGVMLLLSETALLATSVTLFAMHDALRDQHVPAHQLEDARAQEAVLRAGNWISAGLFASVALAGIVHAQLRFSDTGALELTPNGALARLRF